MNNRASWRRLLWARRQRRWRRARSLHHQLWARRQFRGWQLQLRRWRQLQLSRVPTMCPMLLQGLHLSRRRWPHPWRTGRPKTLAGNSFILISICKSRQVISSIIILRFRISQVSLRAKRWGIKLTQMPTPEIWSRRKSWRPNLLICLLLIIIQNSLRANWSSQNHFHISRSRVLIPFLNAYNLTRHFNIKNRRISCHLNFIRRSYFKSNSPMNFN